MAFVYQAERDINNASGALPSNVGPGSYIENKKYEVRAHAAPFNTQVARSKPLKKSNSPGPGSYNVEFVTEGQRVVLQSAQSEVKIVEQQKQQSVFMSQTKRFQEPKMLETPGPGAYDSTQQKKMVQQQYTSQNYIDHLMKLNKYQSIPSIPTTSQVYGYTDKGPHDLELNKSPVPIFTGLKQDTVGPGQYQLRDTFDNNKNKGPSWHKSRVPKLVPPSREQIVGPGAYDHENSIIPLYKLNPSGNFLSKSQRMFDQQKGQKTREFMRAQFENQKKKLMQNPVFADIEDEDVEFYDNATPGPGYYMGNQTTFSTASTYSQSMPKSQSGFGSKQKRFNEQQRQIQMGPGDYRIDTNLIKNNMAMKNIPFLSSNTRFESRALEKKPGPQTYNPKITLEDKLIKKLERAPVGKFGSNQPRFDDPENEQPGPGTYEPNFQDPAKNAACVFKSQTKRSIMGGKDNMPAPGAYDVKNYTIENKTKVEKEEDKDLIINKPGFGSSLPRFQEKPKKGIDEEDEEEDIQLKHNASDLFQKKKKEHPAFNCQEKRFQYEQKNNVAPGPGEYFDQKQNPWDKKTFNILFSEI
ncbi:unnamed protein product [Paramecium sonneborni]|uniref:Sperm-tail PG-rich repeat protein n=1 Tax=Paramecium sonneborni TaxID=65129 RepID=A0A8S1NCD3_9CILI|nr:unnamed protein product [Paramecium sonneborni]